MKCYKAHLKEEYIDRWDSLVIVSPVIINEEELDRLIDGDSIEIEFEGVSIKLHYNDLRMITTCD